MSDKHERQILARALTDGVRALEIHVEKYGEFPASPYAYIFGAISSFCGEELGEKGHRELLARVHAAGHRVRRQGSRLRLVKG